MASVGEDTLLELVKQVEARMNSAVEGVTDVLPSLKISEEEAPQEAELASELVKEVWEVVDQNYLDARGTGFDHERCSRARACSQSSATISQCKGVAGRIKHGPFVTFCSRPPSSARWLVHPNPVGLTGGAASGTRPLPAVPATGGQPTEPSETCWPGGSRTPTRASSLPRCRPVLPQDVPPAREISLSPDPSCQQVCTM